MSDRYDTDETLQELGYGRPRGRWKTVVIVLLLLLLLPAVGGVVFLGRLWSEEQAETLTLRNQVEVFTAQLSQLESKNSELSSLLADKQAETERLKEEWAAQVASLETQHKEQLQRTYGQMNEIVHDSKKTLAYIGDIEARLKKGENLNRAEAAKLTGVINGLTFLHQQYKKPLNEFRELDRYFTRQLAAIPNQQDDPLETTPLGKRIFRNREFREERAKYFEEQGRRSALVEARGRVQTAYANAQKQMANVSLDMNKYLLQLDQLVESNQRSAQEVADFFQTSKEILKIHDRIMEVVPAPSPGVKP